MTTLFQRLARPVAGPAAAAAITVGLFLVALVFSSSASAQSSPKCSDDAVAPTGPATISAAWTTSYGRVLVEGSGPYAGCSLYLLTSDQLHALAGAPFACSDNANALSTSDDPNPCDSDLWPALLTKGAPIAGPGVNPRLLGTVTRTDFDFLTGGSSVKQVTYNGYPLYRFFLDTSPGNTQGANLDDPVPSTPGVWYLVDPHRGTPATGRAHLQLETAPVDGTGADATVLAATMNNDFSAFADASFPLYTLSHERGEARRHELGATRAPVRGCVPFTGHRSSPQPGRSPGPALTSMPSGSSSDPTAATR